MDIFLSEKGTLSVPSCGLDNKNKPTMPGCCRRFCSRHTQPCLFCFFFDSEHQTFTFRRFRHSLFAYCNPKRLLLAQSQDHKSLLGFFKDNFLWTGPYWGYVLVNIAQLQGPKRVVSHAVKGGKVYCNKRKLTFIDVGSIHTQVAMERRERSLI